MSQSLPRHQHCAPCQGCAHASALRGQCPAVFSTGISLASSPQKCEVGWLEGLLEELPRSHFSLQNWDSHSHWKQLLY